MLHGIKVSHLSFLPFMHSFILLFMHQFFYSPGVLLIPVLKQMTLIFLALILHEAGQPGKHANIMLLTL